MAQENLEPVEPSLRRVHHPGLLGGLFDRYDPQRARFVATEVLAFEYPGSPRDVEPPAPEPAMLAASAQLVRSLGHLSAEMRDRFASLARFACHIRVRRTLAVGDSPAFHVFAASLIRTDSAIYIIVKIKHVIQRASHVLLHGHCKP